MTHTTASTTRFVLTLGLISFFLIGLQQSILGPSSSGFSSRFDITSTTASNVISIQSMGAIAGTLMSGIALRLWKLRTVALLAAILASLGLSIMGFSPYWWGILVGTCIGGLGYGSISAVFNTLMSTFGVRSTHVLNLLNATWGLGSMFGPYWVLILSAKGTSMPFTVLSLGFLALAFGTRFLDSGLNLKTPPQHASANFVSPWLASSFAALLFVYTATEVSIGYWMNTHLTPLIGAESATLYNTLFWSTLTVGRFIAVPLSARLHPSTLVLGSSTGMLFAATLLHTSQTAPYAYILLGLFCAPAFATIVAWFGTSLPQLTSLTPYLIAAGGLGSVLLPRLIGYGVDAFGIQAIPQGITLGIATLVAIVVFNRLKFGSKPVSDITGALQGD
ncbi:MAG: MFS transporter [Deinococcaceae bacterium]